jgi:hypothetical protein
MVHATDCFHSAAVEGVACSYLLVNTCEVTCSGLPTDEATAFDSSFKMSELSTELPGTAVNALHGYTM